VRRLASLVCRKAALQEALEASVEEEYDQAIHEPFLYVPEGDELRDYATRQGHLVKQDDEGVLAANFFAEVASESEHSKASLLKNRIAARKLAYRLKPYLDAERPYVLLIGDELSRWQPTLWQVCPDLRNPGNYAVKFGKGTILTNVEAIAVEQEYLAKYGPKMARVRVLSLLEGRPAKPSKPVLDFEAYVNEEPGEGSEPEGEQVAFEEDSDLELEVPTTDKAPSKEMMKAVYRLHQNTGHTSRRRLARALIIAGAPPEAVKAAKMLKCTVCDENKKPQTRMATALPRVEHPGDHVCADLFSMKDSGGKIYWIAHLVDLASRYQVCRLLPDKSADEVVKCLSEWVRILGAPKALTVDMGPEFVAGKFQSACDFYDVCLHHTPVEAPWKNAVAERSGQTTKAILKHLIKEHSAYGNAEMEMMLAAASEAYNGDVGDSGFSPAQFMLGKQPRTVGDGLALAPRLSQLGVLEAQPSMARQVAIRETAKVATIRMRFSTTLRKALAARPRVRDEIIYEPGEIVYFWRQQAKGKRLPTKKWHGPAMVIAVEKGETGVQSALYASYRGGVTKVAIEHVRPASSLERLAAGTWESALQGVLDAIEPGEGDPPGGGDQPQPAADPAPGQPSAAVDALRSLGNEAAAPPLVVVGAPSDPSFSRRVSADFSRASSSWERRGHELWTRGQSGGGASSLEPTDKKRTSEAAGLQQPQLGGPGQATVPEAEGEVEQSAPQRAPETTATTTAPSAFTGPFVPLTLGGRNIDVMIAEKCKQHPLWELQERVAKEIANGDFDEPINGTWDGRWPTPSEAVRKELCRTGNLKNLPNEPYDVLLTSGGREFQWSKMDNESRTAFQKAAEDQWAKWVDNEALEPIPPKEADVVRKRLASQGKLGEILVPRFVLTDKNSALSTKENPLPLKANARLVVPGYRDSSYLAGKLQTDAPTASRVAFFMLLSIVGFHPEWFLLCGDVRSAFLKGDPYVNQQRQLFMGLPNPKVGPSLPVALGTLFKVRKGVFGLADAPREWYKRLVRELESLGWTKSCIDGAFFMKWENGTLVGALIAHVDDMVMAGTASAKRSFVELGSRLEFGSLEEDSFVFCGKKIQRLPSGEVVLTMREYHENLKIPVVPRARRKDLSSLLSPSENRQLKQLTGSLQWLVSQLRFDKGFSLSSIQSEPPTVGALLRACTLARELQGDPHFALTFRRVDYRKGGIVTNHDAALGNVDESGNSSVESYQKTHSQSCYCVMLGDPDLMQGQPGFFNVLDFRSHKLQRVARSSYAAETLGCEEALDNSELCRALLAEVRGVDVLKLGGDLAVCSVPELLVTDAKDTHDRVTKETGYGAQKSLVLTLAGLRQSLKKPNTALRWTDTSNMFVDGGTKEMLTDHLRTVLTQGRWSVQYDPEYVKAKGGKKKKPAEKIPPGELPGREVRPDDADLMKFIEHFSLHPGWHRVREVGVQVAVDAKSYRSPLPRLKLEEFPYRTTVGLFQESTNEVTWRILEEDEDLRDLSRLTDPLPVRAARLVTLYRPAVQATKEDKPCES